MKVLILGANGMLGPWVSKALSNHEIIETDLERISTNTNFIKIDISNTKDVLKISEGVDEIINLILKDTAYQMMNDEEPCAVAMAKRNDDSGVDSAEGETA